jgi:hypothetical protein
MAFRGCVVFFKLMHTYHSTKFFMDSAGISEDLVARLKSHEDLKHVELDVFMAYRFFFFLTRRSTGLSGARRCRVNREDAPLSASRPQNHTNSTTIMSHVQPIPCRHDFSSSLPRMLHVVQNAGFQFVTE